ncbi:MAG: penicillin-binding protein 1A [bacterium]
MKRKFRDFENNIRNLSFFHDAKSFIQARQITSTLIGLVIIGIGGLTYLYIISRDLPSLRQLEEYKPKLASKVYSADMKLIYEYYEEKRSYVPLEQIPETLKQAVIATEDRRFYEHWGMNVKRFAQAFLINAINLSFKQGASTLTQQLARQLYLTTEKTITRKIKELITAIQIERTYTKEEILEMYLNHMYFGHGSYGAQSAALKYFGKNLDDLTVDECAVLVGLLKAPEYYTPIRHPNRALTRRNIVLHAMRELDFITEDEYNEYLKKPISVLKYTTSTAYGIAPYFTEYVRQILQEKYGYNLYTDGLSIFTTLDTRAQACAEEAVEDHLRNLQKTVNGYYFKDNKRIKELLDPDFLRNHDVKKLLQDSTFVDSLLNTRVAVQTALVSIDPRNGHILAFIGGRDFAESKFNRVVQARRQPGSAFKPFVYTAAIDNGYPTTYEVLNQPVVVYLENGDRWSPQNYDLSVGGPTTFREGLRRSLNLVTVRVLQEVIQKPSRVVEYARKMGIKSPLQPVDAIALGASDVTPMEITSAFGVFANGGVLVEPVAILRVEDKNGNVLEQNIPRSQEALRKETAYIMTDLLKTVIDKGTGGSARWKWQFYRPAGGKTGTTNDFSDAWFIGFTPQIVTGVWVGLDDYSLTLGKGQDGARTALPIWAKYMKAVHDTLALPELDFPMPEGVVRVEVCADTKKLANDVCPTILDEVFESRLAPTEHCDMHVSLTRRERLKRLRDKERVRF